MGTLEGQPFTCGLYEVCCNLDNFSGSESINNRNQCGRPKNELLKGRISSNVFLQDGDAEFGKQKFSFFVI